jgi:RHS repeat-associated protein
VLWTRQIAPESPSRACFRAADPLKIPIDPNGNLTQKVDGADTWGYEWNARNELTRVTENGVEQARFAYDPLGRRVEKVAGGVTSSYTYDEDTTVRVLSGATMLKYVHGPNVDEALAAEDAQGLSYYHSDGLASIVGATSGAGAVTLTRQYDAWGNLQVDEAAPGQTKPSFAFTGREWDPEIGLYYYRARYYGPQLGRFVSEDPRLELTRSSYSYVANNPIAYADPTGEKEVCVHSFGTQYIGTKAMAHHRPFVSKEEAANPSHPENFNLINFIGSCDKGSPQFVRLKVPSYGPAKIGNQFEYPIGAHVKIWSVSMSTTWVATSTRATFDRLARDLEPWYECCE